jgi:hypothetical protein
MIKSRIIIWAGHIARMGKNVNVWQKLKERDEIGMDGWIILKLISRK